MLIVNDLQKLSQKSVPVDNMDEARDIISKLESELSKIGGLGLSAPQIGIFKQVAIIRCRGTNEDIINPEEVKFEGGKFLSAREGCLSFPDDRKNIYRYEEVSLLSHFGKGYHYFHIKNKGDLVLAAVQHELDHLNGITIINNPDVMETVRKAEQKVGPNQPCPCGSGKKYKKCCG